MEEVARQQRLYDWQRMLRDNVVVRSVLRKESGFMRCHIELLFMGHEHVYHAIAYRNVAGKGYGHMGVERYEGPIYPLLENLFNRWFGQEVLVVAHAWLTPVTHVTSVNLIPGENCWALSSDANPLFMHYYGIIHSEIGRGDADCNYPSRKNVPESDWHILSKRFGAFLRQQEQKLFEEKYGELAS